MRSPRAALLAVAVLCLLPVAPALADHVRVRPPPRPVPRASAAPDPAPVTPAFGPRVRVRRTVAAGQPLLLPAVDGKVRVVCTGPVMRGALLWLERDAQGRTAVHRQDGGRQFDITYRVVRGLVSVARERCP